MRELRNVCERHALGLGDIGQNLRAAPEEAKALTQRVEDFERTLLRQALTEHGGNIRAVTESLGLARRTLNEKMRKYDLSRNDFR